MPAMEIDLSIVIPVFNEQDNVGLLHEQLCGALEPLGRSYEILLINDGSHDGTEAKLLCLGRDGLSTVQRRSDRP
jgi:glycosyltransferase involved in cell wall biosynthesis